MNVHLVRLIVLIVLVLLSAFFSSAETAFMTVNRVKIKALADEGNKRAASVIRICEDTQKMLSAILIGNNIVNLSASALMTVFVTDLWGSFAVGIGTGVLTLVVLIVGEILPKTIATAYSENMSLWYAEIIIFIMAITKPLSFISLHIGFGIVLCYVVITGDPVLLAEGFHRLPGRLIEGSVIDAGIIGDQGKLETCRLFGLLLLFSASCQEKTSSQEKTGHQACCSEDPQPSFRFRI